MYANLQTTRDGAKKILIAAELAQKFVSGGGMHGTFNPRHMYVILTERIAYDTSGSSPCKRAMYKGHQVYLDDSIDGDEGFNFVQDEDGLLFDEEEDDAADNLVHLSDHSFLRLGMVYEAISFIGSTDRVEGWYIQSIDYEGPWQASLDPEDKAVVVIGAHREDADYPWDDNVEIIVQGTQLVLGEDTENPEVLFEEVEQVNPPEGAGYIYYTITASLGFNSEFTLEAEIFATDELPEDEFEDTTDQPDGEDPTGALIYTYSEAIAYYIKKGGEICHLTQMASKASVPKALSAPLDLKKLSEDLNVEDNFSYEAGCALLSSTGTATATSSTITFDVNVPSLVGNNYMETGTGTGTCTALDVNITALAVDMAGDCLTDDGAGGIDLDKDDLAGAGLVPAAGCGVDVGAGTYITVNPDDVTIDVEALAAFMAGNCITAAAGKLSNALLPGVGMTQTGCNLNVTATGTNTVVAGCGLEFGTGTAIDDLSVVPADLAGAGLRTGAGLCDLALGINTLVAGTPDPYADFVAYSDGNVVINHNKVTFANSLHAFNGYTSGNDQFLVHQGGGTIGWVDEGDGIFISAGDARLDIMSCSTVTPTPDDFIAFGNTGIGIANEKATFEDFIKSISGGTSGGTRMLVLTAGVLSWEEVDTC